MADSEQKIDPNEMLQTSIRLRAGLKKLVEHEIVERGSSLQKAIDEGLELWLATPHSSATGNPANAGNPADVKMHSPSDLPSFISAPPGVSLAELLPQIGKEVSLILKIVSAQNGKSTGITEPPRRPRKPGGDPTTLVAETGKEFKRGQKEIAAVGKKVVKASPRANRKVSGEPD